LSTSLKVGDKAPNFQFDTPWTSSQDFYETVQHQDAIFVFLRYYGCPVCQMEMANLKRDIELFNQKGARVFRFSAELNCHSHTSAKRRRLAI